MRRTAVWIGMAAAVVGAVAVVSWMVWSQMRDDAEGERAAKIGAPLEESVPPDTLGFEAAVDTAAAVVDTVRAVGP